MQNVVVACWRLSVSLMAILAFSNAAASTVTYWDKPDAETFTGPESTAISYGPNGIGSPDYVHMSFDIVTQNVVGSDFAFIIHFDTPTVQTTYLHGGVGASISGNFIGNWQDGEHMHVDIWVDMQANTWTIALGDFAPVTAQFNHSGSIRSVRYGLTPWKGGTLADPSVTATVSNMKITNAASSVVPIPAAAWLFGSALLGLGSLHRRRKSA